MDEDLQQPETPPQGDLLDERVLPPLGLSISALLVIFVGGGLGTVARYLMAHPFAAKAGIPSVTLVVNLSGSMAIGLLIPLTEHLNDRLPRLDPFWQSGFWVAGPPTRPWPSTPSSWPSTDASPPWSGILPPPSWAESQPSSPAMSSAIESCHRDRDRPPHSRPRAAGRLQRWSGCRPARLDHPSHLDAETLILFPLGRSWSTSPDPWYSVS